MSTLLNLLVAQPNLLVGHAIAYAELGAQEAAVFSRACTQRALLIACAFCTASLAWGLAGVSIMLWFATPVPHADFPLPLILVPLLPAVVFVWCILQLTAAKRPRSFDKLRQQLMADKALLGELRLP